MGVVRKLGLVTIANFTLCAMITMGAHSDKSCEHSNDLNAVKEDECQRDLTQVLQGFNSSNLLYNTVLSLKQLPQAINLYAQLSEEGRRKLRLDIGRA